MGLSLIFETTSCTSLKSASLSTVQLMWVRSFELIRLKILIAKLEQKNIDQTIEKLQSFLLTLQAQNIHKSVNGGFYEEFGKSIFGWKKTLKVNSWATMFSLQALFWIENFSKIDFEKETELLY